MAFNDTFLLFFTFSVHAFVQQELRICEIVKQNFPQSFKTCSKK